MVNHRKMKSLYYKINLRTFLSSHNEMKEFSYITKMYNQSTVKLYVPNNIA